MCIDDSQECGHSVSIYLGTAIIFGIENTAGLRLQTLFIEFVFVDFKYECDNLVGQ